MKIRCGWNGATQFGHERRRRLAGSGRLVRPGAAPASPSDAPPSIGMDVAVYSVSHRTLGVVTDASPFTLNAAPEIAAATRDQV